MTAAASAAAEVAASVSVLVVDDDDDTRSLLGICLTREGWHVTLVSTLSAAQTALATGHFNVLMTDFYLGDGKGTELLNRDRPEGLRVAILMSGSPHPGHTIASAGRAFDAVLQKPIDRLVMVTTIRRFLSDSAMVQ